MKHIFALSLMLGFLIAPQFVYSEETEQQLTREQVEELVLQGEPGNVIGYDVDQNEDGNKIHNFVIAKEDGTVMQIQTNEQGIVVSRKFEKLGEGVELPPAAIEKAVADKTALDHINETKFGVKGRVLASQYKLYNGSPAYEVIVKKSMKDTYHVYVDPNDGTVLSTEYVK